MPDEAILSEARRLADPARDEDHLGFWAFFRLAPSAMSSRLTLAASRFANRAERDDERPRMLDVVEERMRQLEGGNAERHFLQISGYALEDLPPVVRSQAPTVAAAGVRRPDRPALASRVRPGMLALMSLLLLVALFSRSSDPLAPSLAALSEAQPVIFGSLGETVRGHRKPEQDETTMALVQVLERIEAARTSLLGIHTGYERDSLVEASRALEQALAMPELDESLAGPLSALKVGVEALISSPDRALR
ncbi:MAG: hypothetical protein O3C45_01895 [Bacteroidetes bacterium]|nr:hypothetical protein [Bacteroidota bacterium]